MNWCGVQVLSIDGTQEVGKISKQWSGLAKEFFTNADNFGIQCKHVSYYLTLTVCTTLDCHVMYFM